MGDRRSIFVAIVAFLVAAVNVSATTITATVTNAVVGEGDSLRLSCIVTNLSPNFMIWLKQTTKGPVKLATNYNLESAYAPLSPNRYRMSIGSSDPTTSTFEFVFNINNAQLEDSGDYTCSVPSVPGVVASFSIVVARDPDNLVINAHNYATGIDFEIEGGSLLPISLKAQYDITFTASGANPAANVTVLAGPWFHPGSVQVTTTPHVVHTAYPGLDRQTFTTVTKYTGSSFDFFVQPKEITCSAYVTAGNYTGDVESASFYAKYVDFAPIVNCQEQTLAKPGDNSAFLHCNVTAPIDTPPTFTFNYTQQGQNITLEPGQTSPDGVYKADATLHGEVYTMHLAVLKVPHTAFGTYGFSASNNMGSDYDESILVKASDQPSTTKPTPGGASGGNDGTRIGVAVATIVLTTLTSLSALI